MAGDSASIPKASPVAPFAASRTLKARSMGTHRVALSGVAMALRVHAAVKAVSLALAAS